ncbi:MAG: hypothetical protein C4289_00545 [Chloroflexota bacterium]
MRVLVTGATGFLGRYLVAALQERGYRVHALVLPSEDPAWLSKRGVTIYQGDSRYLETLAGTMQGIDGIFHLAALTRFWRPLREYYAVNVTGTANICQAALAARVRRFIHVSSAVVYGFGIGQPAREEFPLQPLAEPYSVSKAEGERIVQHMIARERLPAVIIRPGTVFGPGDSLNFGRIAHQLLSKRGIIIGSGRNALSLVYVTDVIQGLIFAFESDQAVGNIYNIGNDRPVTQEEALYTIADAVGARRPEIHVPLRLLYVLAKVSECASTLAGYMLQPLVTRQGVLLYGTDNRLCIEKARRELGYVPQVSVQEGLQRTGRWFREQRVHGADALQEVPRCASS